MISTFIRVSTYEFLQVINECNGLPKEFNVLPAWCLHVESIDVLVQYMSINGRLIGFYSPTTNEWYNERIVRAAIKRKYKYATFTEMHVGLLDDIQRMYKPQYYTKLLHHFRTTDREFLTKEPRLYLTWSQQRPHPRFLLTPAEVEPDLLFRAKKRETNIEYRIWKISEFEDRKSEFNHVWVQNPMLLDDVRNKLWF